MSSSLCRCMFVCMFVCICVCVSACRSLPCRFDKEIADIMQEMKKGGVLEVHKKPAPPLSELSAVDSQQWQGLNISFLHTHYPGWLLFTYLLPDILQPFIG